MKKVRSPKALQAEMRRVHSKGKTIGFVPTMGALHPGHISLVEAARQENDIVVASIFVNPTQFGPKEDLKKYPRTLNSDLQMLRQAKTDYVFTPTAEDIYPEGFSTYIEVESPKDQPALSHILCGKYRPGHFRGVATVVTKLFSIVQPDRAYFGAKDYQQAAIIRRLIEDLNLGIDLKVMPTVREADGIAMSSRNRYLNPEERQRALALSRTLFWMRERILKQRGNLAGIRKEGIQRLKPSVDAIDYLEIVDPFNLQSLTRFQPEMVLLTACYVGKTRLIDNVIMRASKKGRG